MKSNKLQYLELNHRQCLYLIIAIYRKLRNNLCIVMQNSICVASTNRKLHNIAIFSNDVAIRH